MTDQATPAKVRLTDGLGPLVDKWAADEYVQFVSRSDGRRTTTTVSREALLLLAARIEAAERERCAKHVANCAIPGHSSLGAFQAAYDRIVMGEKA